jgi:hypothetical protein
LEGWQDGRLEGIMIGGAHGEVRGKATLLLQLLEYRFGQVPEDFKQRVLALTSDQLSQSATYVLTAQSLEEVLSALTKH